MTPNSFRDYPLNQFEYFHKWHGQLDLNQRIWESKSHALTSWLCPYMAEWTGFEPVRRRRRPRSLANFPFTTWVPLHINQRTDGNRTRVRTRCTCAILDLLTTVLWYMIVTKKKDFIMIKNKGWLRCRFPSHPSVVLKIITRITRVGLYRLVSHEAGPARIRYTPRAAQSRPLAECSASHMQFQITSFQHRLSRKDRC